MTKKEDKEELLKDMEERGEIKRLPHETSYSRLTERRQKAVDYFMAGMGKVASLQKAGFGKTYARAKPHIVFNNVLVMEAIEEKKKELEEMSQVDEEWVVARLKAIAGADMASLLKVLENGLASIDLNRLDPMTRAALEEITIDEFKQGRGEGARDVVRVRVKMASKLKALEMLCRKLGLFEDKITVQGDKTLVERLNAGRARSKPSLKVVK